MQLSELRAAVYSQVDLEEDDLPTSTVDLFLREAFQRTVQREQRWPTYESEWAVETDVLTPSKAPFPTNMAGLIEVLDPNGYPLTFVPHDVARTRFGPTSRGALNWFSIWGGQVHLWPTPTATGIYEVRGWRKPVDFAVVGNASDVPDCDDRLHLPLVHYACSRVMAQQEDEILERTYLDSWSRGAEMATQDIMRPMRTQPVIVNGGLSTYTRRPSQSVWSMP